MPQLRSAKKATQEQSVSKRAPPKETPAEKRNPRRNAATTPQSPSENYNKRKRDQAKNKEVEESDKENEEENVNAEEEEEEQQDSRSKMIKTVNTFSKEVKSVEENASSSSTTPAEIPSKPKPVSMELENKYNKLKAGYAELVSLRQTGPEKQFALYRQSVVAQEQEWKNKIASLEAELELRKVQPSSSSRQERQEEIAELKEQNRALEESLASFARENNELKAQKPPPQSPKREISPQGADQAAMNGFYLKVSGLQVTSLGGDKFHCICKDPSRDRSVEFQVAHDLDVVDYAPIKISGEGVFWDVLYEEIVFKRPDYPIFLAKMISSVYGDATPAPNQ